MCIKIGEKMNKQTIKINGKKTIVNVPNSLLNKQTAKERINKMLDKYEIYTLENDKIDFIKDFEKDIIDLLSEQQKQHDKECKKCSDYHHIKEVEDKHKAKLKEIREWLEKEVDKIGHTDIGDAELNEYGDFMIIKTSIMEEFDKKVK